MWLYYTIAALRILDQSSIADKFTFIRTVMLSNFYSVQEHAILLLVALNDLHPRRSDPDVISMFTDLLHNANLEAATSKHEDLCREFPEIYTVQNMDAVILFLRVAYSDLVSEDLDEDDCLDVLHKVVTNTVPVQPRETHRVLFVQSEEFIHGSDDFQGFEQKQKEINHVELSGQVRQFRAFLENPSEDEGGARLIRELPPALKTRVEHLRDCITECNDADEFQQAYVDIHDVLVTQLEESDYRSGDLVLIADYFKRLMQYAGDIIMFIMMHDLVGYNPPAPPVPAPVSLPVPVPVPPSQIPDDETEETTIADRVVKRRRL